MKLGIRFFGLVVMASLLGCGNVKGLDEPKTSASDASDLGKPLSDPNTLAYKTERLLRKLKLAQFLTAHKLGVVTSDLAGCFADTNSPNYWELSCPASATTGRLSFIVSQNVVSAMELESSTSVQNFGLAKEELRISEINGQSEADGTQIISFKLSWDLFKDSFVESSKVCTGSSGRVYFSVKGGVLLSLTSSRISLSCKELTAGTTTNSFSLEVAPVTIVPDANGVWTADLPFSFFNSLQKFSGRLVLSEGGLFESKNKIQQPWQCEGAPLCFP